jgi:hypothetical protein
MSFSLRATLGLDGSNFESKLLEEERLAEHSGKRIKESLEGGGLFGGGALAEMGEGLALFEVAHFSQELIEAGTRVRALSVNLGVGTDAVQVYERAFDGLDHVTAVLDKLAKAKEEAIGGGADADKFTAAFQRLGVSAEDLQSKNLEELFAQIGEHIQGATIDTRTMADELEILGKSGTSLNEGFKRGLGEVREELEKTGALLDKHTLDADKTMHEFEQSVWGSIKGIANKIIATPFVIGTAFKAIHDGNVADANYWSVDNQQAGMLKASEDAKAKCLADAKAIADAEQAGIAATDAAHKKYMDDCVALDQQTADIQEKTRQEGLTGDQKRMELVKKRADLEQQVPVSQGMDKSELLLSIAEINAEIAKIHPDKVEAEKAGRTRPEHMDVNAAQRVGAYAHMAMGADLAKESNKTLTEIKHTLARIESRGGQF